MKNNLTLQLIYRSAYLVLAVFALLLSVGVWGEFRPLFVVDFFNWAIVMSIVATIFALIDNVRSAKEGKTHAFSDRFPVLKFCTMSSMLFCFILGAFFINRIGTHALTDTAVTEYGSIFPGIATAGYWTDISVFLPRFVIPLAYMIGFVLMEERLKSRSIYGTIGIVPPTIYYFFCFFLSLIVDNANGGATVMPTELYAMTHPYFFFDSAFTYTGWWWILIWPTIFGVSLMLLNNIVYYITRTTRNENGKLKLYKKLKPEEDSMRDFIHAIKVNKENKKIKE